MRDRFSKSRKYLQYNYYQPPGDQEPTKIHQSILNCLIFLFLSICLIISIYLLSYAFETNLFDTLLHTKSLLTSANSLFSNIKQMPYCKTIPYNAYNNTNITYYNNFPTNITIEDIIKKRTEPIENIPMCSTANKTNYNQYKQILSKLPTNLIAYTNRCQINAINRGKRQFGGLLSGDPLKSKHSTQIGFLHVYKAGGTTVRDTMNAILPGQSRVTWNKYRGHIREFMSHLFMFSHIRDPITRTISGFFELHRRNESEISKNNLIGVDSFRYMLQLMNDRMDCSLSNKTKQEKMSDNIIGATYFNMHIMPQMYFLTEASNPWKLWPVNYIGNMTELTESTFEILYHFYWNTSDYLDIEKQRKYLNKKEAFEIYNDKYHHGRNRHNQKYLDGGERRAAVKGRDVLKYQLEFDDLSDRDIKRICDIYWMDYICIPFDMPKACNLTELLLRHYGDDVVYKDCWEYNTQEWDGAFLSKYKQSIKSVRGKRGNMKRNRYNNKKNMGGGIFKGTGNMAREHIRRAKLKQRNQLMKKQFEAKYGVSSHKG
eukprot:185828_1